MKHKANQSLGLVSLVVRDYDEAIEFFVNTLGFRLVEDTPVPEQSKRWVVVSPPGAMDSQLFCLREHRRRSKRRVLAHRPEAVFFFFSTQMIFGATTWHIEKKELNSFGSRSRSYTEQLRYSWIYTAICGICFSQQKHTSNCAMAAPNNSLQPTRQSLARLPVG